MAITKKIDEKGKHDEPTGGISSVLRSFDILEYMSAQQGEFSVPELSNELKLNRATAYNLVRSLNQKGYVLRGESGKYRLSSKLFQLGTMYRDSFGIVNIFERNSVAFAVEMQCSLYLAVMSEPGVGVVLDRTSHQELERFPTGSKIPLHATALGKVLLAYGSEEQLENYLATEPLEKYAENTIVDEAALKAELAHIRAVGYAHDNGEFMTGAECFSAPIFNFQRNMIASVSMSQVSEEHCAQHELTAARLKEFANVISVAMGYRMVL